MLGKARNGTRMDEWQGGDPGRADGSAGGTESGGKDD
jgi:hypothetical protein